MAISQPETLMDLLSVVYTNSWEYAVGFTFVAALTQAFIMAVQYVHFDAGKTDGRGPVEPVPHSVMIMGAGLLAVGSLFDNGLQRLILPIGVLLLAFMCGHAVSREMANKQQNLWWLEYIICSTSAMALSAPKLLGVKHPVASGVIFFHAIRTMTDYTQASLRDTKRPLKSSHNRSTNTASRFERFDDYIERHYKGICMTLYGMLLLSTFLPAKVSMTTAMITMLAFYAVFSNLYRRRLPGTIALTTSPLPEKMIFTLGTIMNHMMSMFSVFCHAYGMLHPQQSYLIGYGRKMNLAMGLSSLYVIREYMLSVKRHEEDRQFVEGLAYVLHLSYISLSFNSGTFGSARLALSIGLIATQLISYLLSDESTPNKKQRTPQEFLWSAVHCGVACWLQLDVLSYETPVSRWTYAYMADKLSNVFVAKSLLTVTNLRGERSGKLDKHSQDRMRRLVS